MRNSPRVNNYSTAIPPLTIECRDLTAQLSLDIKPKSINHSKDIDTASNNREQRFISTAGSQHQYRPGQTGKDVKDTEKGDRPTNKPQSKSPRKNHRERPTEKTTIVRSTTESIQISNYFNSQVIRIQYTTNNN